MPESTNMMQRFGAMFRFAVLIGLGALCGAAGVHAEEGGGLQQSEAKATNIAAVQRGARLYFNYCSGCHSIKYMSYSRLAEDLKLAPDDVLKNFAFSGAKIGDQV